MKINEEEVTMEMCEFCGKEGDFMGITLICDAGCVHFGCKECIHKIVSKTRREEKENEEKKI